MTELRFEDLHVGQRLTSDAVTVTEVEILAFARVFDPQPMHVDTAWAQASPLGSLIASGWHTASLAMRLQQATGLPATGLQELKSLAWPLPVRPGDVIHVDIEVTAVAPAAAPEHGLVEFENTTRNGKGETVQVITGTVLVQRRRVVA